MASTSCPHPAMAAVKPATAALCLPTYPHAAAAAQQPTRRGIQCGHATARQSSVEPPLQRRALPRRVRESNTGAQPHLQGVAFTAEERACEC